MSHETGGKGAGERVVYVIPSEAVLPATDREIDLAATLRQLWAGRWRIVGATIVSVVGAVGYLAVTPPWYRAEVVLMPAQGRSVPSLPGSLAGLSGLAGLAGISIGGGDAAEPLAVLTSSNFSQDFVRNHGLIPTLFAEDWDARRAAWKDADPATWPDERDAVKRLDEKVRRVFEDRRTGKVRLVIEWTDPEVAADWANAMVDDLNDRMRKRALQEAETNLAYLRGELENTSLVTLQQSISRLIDGEIQKAMLAKGESEFSFRVIDRAGVPKWRAGPRPTLVLALAAIVGASFGVLLVLLHDAFSRRDNGHDGGSSGRRPAGS